MSGEGVLERTKAVFRTSHVTLESLEKGGSDRLFFRIHFTPGEGLADSMVVTAYDATLRPENERYALIAQWLEKHGASVPKVWHAEPGFIWLEDLGDTDLWSLRDLPWDQRCLWWLKALDVSKALHDIPASRWEKSDLTHELAFDEALYSWEQAYFFEHCLSRHFGFSGEELSTWTNLPVWAELSQRLAALPRSLVHRDFQSQNLMVYHGDLVMIDFQGLRPGLPEYDWVSLLWDPYAPLTRGERSELCQRAFELESPLASWRLHACAIQRLMQALGAYGNLAYNFGKTRYLAYIIPAYSDLIELCAGWEGLENFSEFLQTLKTKV